MDWTTIGVTIGVALVSSAATLLGVYLTNRAAERRDEQRWKRERIARLDDVRREAYARFVEHYHRLSGHVPETKDSDDPGQEELAGELASNLLRAYSEACIAAGPKVLCWLQAEWNQIMERDVPLDYSKLTEQVRTLQQLMRDELETDKPSSA